MAEQKKKIQVFGKEIDVSEVPIVKATEFFNEYQLEDGSFLKVKCVATSIQRVDGQFTPDGRPIYLVYTSPNVNVAKHSLSPTPPSKHTGKSN